MIVEQRLFVICHPDEYRGSLSKGIDYSLIVEQRLFVICHPELVEGLSKGCLRIFEQLFVLFSYL